MSSEEIKNTVYSLIRLLVLLALSIPLSILLWLSLPEDKTGKYG